MPDNQWICTAGNCLVQYCRTIYCIERLSGMQIITIIIYALISVAGLTLVKLGSNNPLSFTFGSSGFSFGNGEYDPFVDK